VRPGTRVTQGAAWLRFNGLSLSSRAPRPTPASSTSMAYKKVADHLCCDLRALALSRRPGFVCLQPPRTMVSSLGLDGRKLALVGRLLACRLRLRDVLANPVNYEAPVSTCARPSLFVFRMVGSSLKHSNHIAADAQPSPVNKQRCWLRTFDGVDPRSERNGRPRRGRAPCS